jgi:hypothetical protein
VTVATETYELRVQGLSGQQYVESVLHFQGTGVTANDTLGNGTHLINAWVAHLHSFWLGMMPISYYVQLLTTRRVSAKPSGQVNKQYQAFTQPGVRGSSAVGLNACPSVFLTPAMGVKSGGRVFLPSVGVGDVVNSQYLAGYSTAVSNFFTPAVTGVVDGGTTWNIAIFSRKLLSTSPAQNFTLSPRLGFQGKRRKAVGA